jgi:hypothetical protein
MTHHPECEDATGKYPGSCTCQPTQSDNNFQNLPLNGSFERVAKVAEERAAFNEQMKIRAALQEQSK